MVNNQQRGLQTTTGLLPLGQARKLTIVLAASFFVFECIAFTSGWFRFII